MAGEKITVASLKACKAAGNKIAALTAYDYPMARLLDETGVPLLLVGDSLGMVVLGHPDTTHVTMEDMAHHVAACARARPRALLAADLPYRSYETPETALKNARCLLNAGAEAVKLEGGREVLPQIRALLAESIPCIGHLGMLPQRVLDEGGYHVKGRSPEEAERLRTDAAALAEAGVCAVVLELVVPEVARQITNNLAIPTIGIGSGGECDGQILVTHDLVGSFPWFRPRFVQPRADLAQQFKAAVSKWKMEVEA
jgi:3-methyl-2-oxobutanoate hydroxymethyltransferase